MTQRTEGNELAQTWNVDWLKAPRTPAGPGGVEGLQPPHPTAAANDPALAWSVDWLRTSRPELSAASGLSIQQRLLLGATIGLIAWGAIVAPHLTGAVLVGVALLWYLANIIDRVVLTARGIDRPDLLQIDDETARAIPDAALPRYTVLLPAFGEANIVRDLISGVGRLEYPADKLEIKLLLESDDELTIQAAREGGADRFAEIVLVPRGGPRTKPKACNYGLASSDGEFLTVYDAEDVPEPLQLRRVVAAFERAPDDVACIQARLGYFNERQNLLTRWFAIEYDQWFGFVLPALSQARATIPLGGTSNHIRRQTLIDAGGWDPFNVTEDADLGVRLARGGYRTAVLDSLTLEEANSDTVNWIRQRSRWYKGYLQTLLVHTRRPVRTIRELGPAAFLRLVSTLTGPATTNLLNVVFGVGAIVWLSAHPKLITDLLPPPLYYAATVSFVLGYMSTTYIGLITTRVEGKPHLVSAVLVSPAYWTLMSIAAAKAVVQLIFQPSYWEKTTHGLTDASPD